jgi:hypothetical protein
MKRARFKRAGIGLLAFLVAIAVAWVVLLYQTGFNAVTGIYTYSPAVTAPDRFFVEDGPEHAITGVLRASALNETTQLSSLDRFEPVSVTVRLYTRYHPVASVDGVYVWKDGARSAGRYCFHATGGGADHPVFALINGGFRARFGVLSSTIEGSITPFVPVIVDEDISCAPNPTY